MTSPTTFTVMHDLVGGQDTNEDFLLMLVGCRFNHPLLCDVTDNLLPLASASPLSYVKIEAPATTTDTTTAKFPQNLLGRFPRDRLSMLFPEAFNRFPFGLRVAVGLVGRSK